MNKRIISVVLCLALILSMTIAAMPAFAAGTTTLTVTADKTTNVHPGDAVTFTVTLGAVSNLGYIKFKLDIP